MPVSLRHLRSVTWTILDTPDADGRYVEASTAANLFIFGLILANVFATIVGTTDAAQQRFGPFLKGFEIFSVTVFTAEYLLRIWSCVESTDYEDGFFGRLRFAKTPFALVDLAAILPFYFTFGLDLRSIRALRLLRIFRLAKVGRYLPALRLFGKVLREKKEEIVVSLASLAILLIITSSFLYYVERGAQPEVFGSIPESLWWAVITVTTVGYGDAYPVTTFGRILGAIVALLGTGVGAVPAGILASGFTEAVGEAKEDEATKEYQYCPHCGSKIEHSGGAKG